MSISKFVRQINEREYPFRLSDSEVKAAKECGYVIVFVEADKMIFHGAIEDYFGCHEGGTAYLLPDGTLMNTHCFEEGFPEQLKEIYAIWQGDSGFSWSCRTDIPHLPFLIMKQGEAYCKGLVFNIANI